MLRRPLLGVLVLIVTVAGQPLVRTVNRIVLNVGGDWAFWGFVLMGLAGAVLVAAALQWGELAASIAGYTGGMLMWHGLAEGCLRFFADQFQVPSVDFGGFPLDGRYALLMSTTTILLGVFLVYGLMNRETRCNFMRWILRRLHWSPGEPTPGMRRSYARITAMETLFVQWCIFVLFLYLGGWLGTAFYTGMLAWSAYLLWRLFRIPRPGMAFRYAIPVGVVLFSLAEVGAFFGAYPEYWKDVLAYPLANLTTLLLFGAALTVVIRGQET
ncbi:MAG: hypothetical protein JSV45_14375 [Chromatiales bacterium]|nr:MAG: hypothetical protein JSV45_14375 [Chromatiales bacterium]